MKYCAICEKPIGNISGYFCRPHYKEFYLPYKGSDWIRFLISSATKVNRRRIDIENHEIPLEEYEYED